MGSFSVIWKNSVHRDLKKIDPAFIPALVRAVKELASDPFPAGYKKLRGHQKLYRIRVGDYRAVYQMDPEHRSITIIRIRHRKDVYE